MLNLLRPKPPPPIIRKNGWRRFKKLLRKLALLIDGRKRYFFPSLRLRRYHRKSAGSIAFVTPQEQKHKRCFRKVVRRPKIAMAGSATGLHYRLVLKRPRLLRKAVRRRLLRATIVRTKGDKKRRRRLRLAK